MLLQVAHSGLEVVQLEQPLLHIADEFLLNFAHFLCRFVDSLIPLQDLFLFALEALELLLHLSLHYSVVLLALQLVVLHSGDDVLHHLRLHLGADLLGGNLLQLLFPQLHPQLDIAEHGRLPLVLVPHELYVLVHGVDLGLLLLDVLGHLVVFLAERKQVFGDGALLVDFERRLHFG